MFKIFMALITISLAGCATSGSAPESNTSQAVEKAEPAAPVEEETSRVLNKNKKCPKNAKVVNGKCMMNVESND